MPLRLPELSLALALTTGAAACIAQEAHTREAPDAAPVTAAAVEHAIDDLTQTELGKKQPVRRLHFKKPAPDHTTVQPGTTWGWLTNLGRWLAQSARLLLLAALALVALVVILRVRDWLGQRARPAPRQRASAAPTHVADLDIRTESLPADVPGTVRALWAQERPREALSLLYRGALSRLVHTHGVPIRSASTESECVRLAQWNLAAEPGAFVARLVDAWQLCVYGGRLPALTEVLALCDGFNGHLGAATSDRPGAAP